jgi:putative redox protein
MVKITASYDGQLHCSATHIPSGSSLSTDAPVDNKGKGETFSPTDLVATALITCIATTVAIKADSLGVELKGMTLEVDKVMSTDLPRRIIALPVKVTLPPGIDPDHKASLLRSIKACPVSHSLHPGIAIDLEVS